MDETIAGKPGWSSAVNPSKGPPERGSFFASCTSLFTNDAARVSQVIGTFLRMAGADGQRLLQGVARYAQEEGLSLRCWDHTHWPAKRPRANLGFDGVIAQVFSAMRPDVFGLPVVNVSPSTPTCGLPRITTDDVGLGEAAASYFLRRGFRHFLYFGHPDHGGSVLRYAGFRRAIESSGYTARHEIVGAFPEEAYGLERRRYDAATVRWLRLLPRPVGAFCFSDYVATFVTGACLELGLRVPQDIAVLGVNNDEAWVHQTPISISSIDPGFEKVGYEAARRLVQHLRTGARLPENLTIRSFKIVSRRSTEAYHSEDESIQKALEFIEEHCPSRIQVADVVRAAGVSRRVLERRFQQKSGLSIHDTILQSRLERAKGLIRSSPDSLKEIAAATGFRDGAHLSETFQRVLRMTPSEYRQSPGRRRRA